MSNHIKELKTTVTGIVLFILGLVYFGLPYFHATELWEVNNLYLGIMLGGGVLLILAPDKIIDFAFSWLNRKKGE